MPVELLHSKVLTKIGSLLGEFICLEQNFVNSSNVKKLVNLELNVENIRPIKLITYQSLYNLKPEIYTGCIKDNLTIFRNHPQTDTIEFLRHLPNTCFQHKHSADIHISLNKDREGFIICNNENIESSPKHPLPLPTIQNTTEPNAQTELEVEEGEILEDNERYLELDNLTDTKISDKDEINNVKFNLEVDKKLLYNSTSEEFDNKIIMREAGISKEDIATGVEKLRDEILDTAVGQFVEECMDMNSNKEGSEEKIKESEEKTNLEK